MKGQVISGQFGKVLVRQKKGSSLEIGELLAAENKDSLMLLQVYDLLYGSQISQQNIELASGLDMEENTGLQFLDPHMRNYNLALLKSLITIRSKNASASKSLPEFFTKVRELNENDLRFLTLPSNPLFVGKLRSGSKQLDFDVNLDGKKALAEHLLISSSTGKGKSNLVKIMLWNLVDKDYCGCLVLDPHDEYYGRNGFGLKDNPNANVVYYSCRDVPSGCKTLKINLKNITPSHFNGVFNWSDPQRQAMQYFYKKYRSEWISAIIKDKDVSDNNPFHEGTVNVVKRTLHSLLDLSLKDGKIVSDGVFDEVSGETTIKEINSELESGKTVIIDTSSFSGALEILIGSLILSESFRNYKRHKLEGNLKDKPVITVVLEEAPRVLGKEVLEKGSNIFSTIAREGRKFKIGLTAITQLPSLIPRTILANMNTKIILGMEMAPERQAIIESSSQDLSEDNRNIASLDKGEAIISSNFVKFATPVKIPFFDDLAKSVKKQTVRKTFSGVNLR